LRTLHTARFRHRSGSPRSHSLNRINRPGTAIKSAWYSSSTATNILTGTSMATPYGSGVAALYLERDPTMTPAQVKAAMQADGSAGVVGNRGTNSPNILLSTVNLGSPNGSNPNQPIPAPTPVILAAPAPTRPANTCRALLSACTGGSQCCSRVCRLKYCFPF
jgi:subtilisin family serine protease